MAEAEKFRSKSEQLKVALFRLESLEQLETSLRNEKTELINAIQRIHERVEEALADQPDNYASFLAVEDIQQIIAKWVYPLIGNPLITLRSEVIWFAEQMEQALRENDYKSGWKDEHQSWLLGELHRNAGKIFDSGYSLRRLVNTANFAMMISDNARGET